MDELLLDLEIFHRLVRFVAADREKEREGERARERERKKERERRAKGNRAWLVSWQ